MLCHVVDAVVVDHRLLTINFDEDVLGAEPVLNNEQRLLPTLPEVVEDDRTGMIVQPCNARQLAEAIRCFFEENKAEEYVKNICDKNGIKIELDSKENQGSTFTYIFSL